MAPWTKAIRRFAENKDGWYARLKKIAAPLKRFKKVVFSTLLR
jgi:hypothetical protein